MSRTAEVVRHAVASLLGLDCRRTILKRISRLDFESNMFPICSRVGRAFLPFQLGCFFPVGLNLVTANRQINEDGKCDISFVSKFF